MRKERMFFVLLAVLAGWITVSWCQEQKSAPLPWGPNICPNNSFEDVDADTHPAGWAIIHYGRQDIVKYSAPEEGCAGKRCLAISAVPLPAGNNEGGVYSVVVSPVIPTEEGWYLVSFWVRAELEAGLKLPGGAAFYLDHFDARGNNLGNKQEDYIWLPPWDSINGQWKYVFQVARQRPEMKGLRLRIPLYPQKQKSYRVLVDAVQVRRLLPPATGPSLNVNTIRNSYYGGISVPDPESSSGTAWKVVPGQIDAGSKIMGGLRKSESPGLYEVTYRFKQESTGKRGILLWVNGGGGGTYVEVEPSDFKENGKYQDFKLLFFYPFGDGSFYSWDWRGEGVYCFDDLTLKLLRPVSYREAWDLFYDGVDPDKVSPPAQ